MGRKRENVALNLPRWPMPKSTTPSPASYEQVNFKMSSVHTYNPPIAFRMPTNWSERQVHRLNMHRARQHEWPSVGEINTSLVEKRWIQERVPSCTWGASTTNRPFLGALPNSAKNDAAKRIMKRDTLRTTASRVTASEAVEAETET